MNESAQLSILEGLPSQDGEPIFEAPWQAKTFAMTLQLYNSGTFTWGEWADELAKNIAAFEAIQPIHGSDDYYSLWQLSLEELLKQKGLIGSEVAFRE